jgi:predicted aspartyl protease
MMFTVLSVSSTRASADVFVYTDKQGTLNFVDDRAKVPRKYQGKIKVRKDPQTPTDADDAASRSGGGTAAGRRETPPMAEGRDNRGPDDGTLTTSVLACGRRILVPVILRHGREEADAVLLLDTGAMFSVISPELADRLKVGDGEAVRVGVLGGGTLSARRAVLSDIEVGPIRKTEQEVIILGHPSGEIGDGILGMSFLSGLRYIVDYEGHTITWIP